MSDERVVVSRERKIDGEEPRPGVFIVQIQKPADSEWTEADDIDAVTAYITPSKAGS